MTRTLLITGEENNTARVFVRLKPTILRDLREILEREGDSVSAFLRRCAIEKINESKVKVKETNK